MTNSTTASEQPSSAPTARPRRGALRNKYVGPLVTACAVILCGTLLVLTIQLTLFDLEWPAFLIGVLFASVVSLVCQAIKAQATIVRRTAQLRRARELLGEVGTRLERCTLSLKAAELRFRGFMDAMPTMVLYVDREQRCREHNRAFGDWCGRGASGINGVPIREVVGEHVYQEIRDRGAQALLGQPAECESHWERSGRTTDVRVSFLPHPAGAQTPSGYYMLVNANDKSPPPEAANEPAPSIEPLALEDEAPGELTLLVEPQPSASDAAREYLLRAIEEDRFTLLEQKIAAVQPRPDALDMREILLRLRDANDEEVAPGGFFDVAEQHGVMPTIDRWVIRNLLKSCSAMRAAERAWRMPIYCVNLSSATVLDVTFPIYIRSQLQHWQIAGSRLCFEISHATVAEHTPETYALMNAVKPLGCRFTIDVFGSHKVSFSHVEQLEFNFAKIHGRIIQGVLTDEAEVRKVSAIVTVCRKLGTRTIAQFVETEETRAKLAELGVEYVQGHGISAPAPLAATAA